MADPVSVENLTVEFDTTTALQGVSHTFEPGTSTAVMGVNGSGKTTMLACLAGLRRPTSGHISGMTKNLGYVCQHPPSGWMPITAGEVLAMGRYRRRGLVRPLRKSDHDAIAEAADLLNVSQFRGRTFGSLSGGQQQRVRIAQVLAGEPDMLMLDEPITGLDIPSQDRILMVIEFYARQGRIVIITTHHINEARHCDYVMLMANRLVAAGAPENMLTPENLREAFGERLIGDHSDHDHDQEMIILDDHGHSGQGRHAHGHDYCSPRGQSHDYAGLPDRSGGHHGVDCPTGPHGR